MRVPHPSDSLSEWLSVRICNSLEGNGFLTVGDLQRNPGKILICNSLGELSLARIFAVLDAANSKIQISATDGYGAAPIEGDAPAGFVPTGHPPGTIGKLQVLAERLENGHPLWHPDDEVGYVATTAKDLKRMRRLMKYGST